MTLKLNRLVWVIVLVILVAIPVYAQESGAQGKSVVRAINSVTPLAETVGRYEKFEIEVDLDADFDNPYDPADIRLDAQFTAPSGKIVTVPGFYYRDFNLELTDTQPDYDRDRRVVLARAFYAGRSRGMVVSDQGDHP